MSAPLSSWGRLAPITQWEDEVLDQISAYLAEPATLATLSECDTAERYPTEVVEHLRCLGVTTYYAEDERTPSRVTPWHVSALNVIAAHCNGSLAITLGVNTLALLPIYFAGTAEQRGAVFARVRAGAFGSILLTEIENGSNLLRNTSVAERGVIGADGVFAPLSDPRAVATHYRLTGDKHLINGGIHHDVFVALLRTRAPGDGSAPIDGLRATEDFSMFYVWRDVPGVLPGDRWRTLPVPAADISGVRFAGAIVPSSQLVGGEGNGFSLAQKTLTISRGGTSCLAAGATGRVFSLAREHARLRNIYGGPVVDLPPVADHVMRVATLEMTAAAMSLKQIAMVNSFGVAAAHYTAVGKFVCCELAEEAVDEGRKSLGAQALLRERPFAAFIRDLPIYATFDGTRHIMLEQIQRRLPQLLQREASTSVNSLEVIRDAYKKPPQRMVELARLPSRVVLLPIAAHLRALAALPGRTDLTSLVQAAELLLVVAAALRKSGAWDRDQGLRFTAAEVLARLEALAALVELGDPDRRSMLGIPPPRFSEDSAFHAGIYRLAIAHVGSRLTDELQRLAIRAGVGRDGDFSAVLGGLMRDYDTLRADLRARVRA
jgi:alkylation response protein AidB-like acyl-CoA dehydrogenase